MSNKQLRNTIRLLHLLFAGCMAAYIYSPLHLNSTFTTVLQLLIVPAVIVSGIVMWQQPRVIKLFKRAQSV